MSFLFLAGVTKFKVIDPPGSEGYTNNGIAGWEFKSRTAAEAALVNLNNKSIIIFKVRNGNNNTFFFLFR